MTAPVPTESGAKANESRQDLASRVKHLVEHAILRDVRLVRWSGELSPGYIAPVQTVRVHGETPMYRLSSGALSCRFDFRVELLDDGEESFGNITADVLVDYELAAECDTDEQTVSCFMDTNAFFMAYPYIREAIHSMSARLGVDAVLLGILRRDELRPSGVTILRNTDKDGAFLSRKEDD
jgi:hypothetical protein